MVESSREPESKPVPLELQSLLRLHESIGSAEFGAALFDWIDGMVPIDFVYLALHGREYRPLKRFVTLDHRQQTIAFRYDLNRLFMIDPNRTVAEQMERRGSVGPVCRLIRFGEIADTRYGEVVHEQMGLADRYSVLTRRGEIWTVINCYRTRERGAFDERDLDRLQELSVLIAAVSELHIGKVHQQLLASNSPEVLEEALRRCQLPVSNRERQVAAHLLAGNDVNEIAESFQVSINTVKTLRRRLFEKLKISRIVELQKRCMQST